MNPGNNGDRYKLIELIREGVMVQVFATRTLCSSQAALKILKLEICHDGHFVAQLLDANRTDRSEQGSWLNWTPKSGLPSRPVGPGLKFS
ncbi:MAG TPA: hypothetical protein VHJ19_13695 [Gammaproteobacteria bacterium]|nr:hypothetical protein [Gammaproteobacteria bacterium]